MNLSRIFNAKDVSEIKKYDFVLDDNLLAGENIVTAVFTISVKFPASGAVDTTPLVTSGGATFNGNVITQGLINGTSGLVYHIKCAATTNLGNVYAVGYYLTVLIK